MASAYRAGVLTLHVVGARGLYCKDLAKGSKTKAYVAILCAGWGSLEERFVSNKVRSPKVVYQDFSLYQR